MTEFTESQKRNVLNTFRHVDDLLWRVERVLATAGEQSLLQRCENDITSEQRKQYRALVEQVREAMERILKSNDIHDKHAPIRATHAVNTGFLLASVAVEELRPKHLRGYGKVSDNDAQGIERLVDDLQELLMRVQRLGAPGGRGVRLQVSNSYRA
jgi:hypothetical protein